jgi:hypothetical protein
MTDDHDPDPNGPRRRALCALLAVLALVAGGWWVQQHLRASEILQDCVLSGRRNCAPVGQ